MAINKAMRAALKALSYPEPDITQTYKLKRQVEAIANKPAKAKAEREKDIVIRDDIIRGRRGYDIPIRIFIPSGGKPSGVIVFFSRRRMGVRQYRHLYRRMYGYCRYAWAYCSVGRLSSRSRK